MAKEKYDHELFNKIAKAVYGAMVTTGGDSSHTVPAAISAVVQFAHKQGDGTKESFIAAVEAAYEGYEN